MNSFKRINGKNLFLPMSRLLGNIFSNRSKFGCVDQTTFWIISGNAKHYSDDPRYGKQLGGYEHKEDIEAFKSLWRKPFTHYNEFWKSKLSVFISKKFSANLLKYNPQNLKYLSFQHLMHRREVDKLIRDQQFNEDRLTILGCDLAAAHFVVFRGGAVKFCNHSNWIRDDKTKKSDYDDDLPNTYHPDYVLEAIDFSTTKIVYEGLVNIENLKKLKWLCFAFCPQFDNWCLDRVSGEFGETLEYLDISYTNVSHHALGVLYRFKNIKTLKVHGISEDLKFISTCQALQQAFPELTIEGISDEILPSEMSETANQSQHN